MYMENAHQEGQEGATDQDEKFGDNEMEMEMNRIQTEAEDMSGIEDGTCA